MPRYFFFYGTLMAGAGNAVALAAHRHLGQEQPATIRGALWAIDDPGGWYPALLPGAGLVHGALYRVLSGFGAKDLALLDAYEGAEYVREPVQVRLEAGMVEAQAYVWAGALPEGAVALGHGDFARFLAEGGHRPFGAAD
ncbi:MAG TPA: gamma-glutamylcyclotransferase family protein [Novosphingobium sp.]|nr:gamma-glutamylcyclotransferase family protein [Novosphingobium sp.]